MGTRGFSGFRVDGMDKLSYNHFDSYPEGLGADVVKFLKLKSNTDAALAALAGSIVLISGDMKPTEAQKEMCRKAGTVDLSVGKQSEDDFYCLLRKAQGDLSSLKNLPLMLSANDFPADSLFAEYGYIINVDTRMLEVYKGFNQDYKAPGRYAALRGKGPLSHYHDAIGIGT